MASLCNDFTLQWLHFARVLHHITKAEEKKNKKKIE